MRLPARNFSHANAGSFPLNPEAVRPVYDGAATPALRSHDGGSGPSGSDSRQADVAAAAPFGALAEPLWNVWAAVSRRGLMPGSYHGMLLPGFQTGVCG